MNAILNVENAAKKFRALFNVCARGNKVLRTGNRYYEVAANILIRCIMYIMRNNLSSRIKFLSREMRSVQNDIFTNSYLHVPRVVRCERRIGRTMLLSSGISEAATIRRIRVKAHGAVGIVR